MAGPDELEADSTEEELPGFSTAELPADSVTLEEELPADSTFSEELDGLTITT